MSRLASKKASTSTTGSTAAGGTTLAQSDLIDQLRSLDKEIANHVSLLRQIPLQVLQPQVNEALGRIRSTMSKLAIPQESAPSAVTRFKPGQTITVTMSPPRQGIVLGSFVDPETKKPGHILLVEGGDIVVAEDHEVTEYYGPPQPSTPQPVSSSSPSSGSQGATAATSSSSGIRAGDTVDTPMGRGVVQQEVPGSTGVYQVMGLPNSPIYLRKEELKVVVPPG